MPFDKTKLLLVNKDVVLERVNVSSKVQEWDIVWFMDGVWRPVDGTLDPMPAYDYNWGIAYHVDPETHTAQIIYDGEVKGCSLIDTIGPWYADRHGKLTTTPTNFYVGFCSTPHTLTMLLTNLAFICNDSIVYPAETDEWGNLESEDVLKLELLVNENYIKWGKDNSEDTTGYIENVNMPTRYMVNNTNFEETHNNMLFFKVSSTNAIMPETCSIKLDGCMEIGVDYKVELTDELGVVLDEEDNINDLFVISPIEESDPNVAYFKVTLLKPFDEVARTGNSLDVYFTDANLQKCNKQNSVFYIWLAVNEPAE